MISLRSKPLRTREDNAPAPGGVIAILTDEYIDYRKILIDRIASVAGSAGYGVVCITGGQLSQHSGYSANVCNNIYPLTAQVQFEGVVCLSGGMIGTIEKTPVLEQALRGVEVPIVSLGLAIPGIPSVTVNDKPGMKDLMSHLLVDSPRRNFVFVRGKKDDQYSTEREQVFRAMLEKHGRSVRESRIVCGNYDTVETYRVVYELLRSDSSVDAIVAANDQMALSAAKAAGALGISIPRELVITGFDDTPDATLHAPAITTVRQPLLKMAELSATALLEQIECRRNNDSCPVRHLEIRSELVVRGSTLIADSNLNGSAINSKSQIESQLAALMSGLESPAGVSLTQIASALWNCISQGSDTLHEVLCSQLEYANSAGHVHWWTNLCHQIESLAGAYLNKQNRSAVLPLVVSALAPVKERIWSLNMDEEFEIRRLQSVQSDIQLQLSASTSMDQILSTMGHWLESIEASRCYLVGFESPSAEPHVFASVMQSYIDGRIEVSGGQYFRTRLLLPAARSDDLKSGLLVLSPVFAGTDLFGYILIDPKGLNRLVLNAAANSIGNAMRSRYLISELEKQKTNLQQVNHDLMRLANFDALTALPNRLSFQRHLRESCTVATREKSSLCLLFIDLDGFKPINDSLGHGTGDLLLKTMASRLGEICAAYQEQDCFIARLGGDEFTVILRGECNREFVEKICADLLATVSRPYLLADQLVNVSASIGFAFFPQHGNTADELLKSADLAMYRAKELGKNRAAIYFAELRDESISLHEHAQALRDALQTGLLRMYYQPRIDLVSGEICAVEALMRWIEDTPDGERFFAPPDVFIHVAERSGLIDKLDTFALESCCIQCREWELAGTPLTISVNLSVVMLQQDNFVEVLLGMLKKYDVNPALMELEITESAAMRNVEENVEKLGRIRELGVGLSIDDFGTGYSSLNYLKQLPVNNLKIDRSFIMEIDSTNESSSADAAIVRSVVALGKSMDFSVIAEGVETGDQVAFVKSLGCHQGQGYFYSRPVPASVITGDWLQLPNSRAA